MKRSIRPVAVIVATATLGLLSASPVLADDASGSTTTTVVSPKAGSRGEATKAVIAAIREYRAALKEFVKTAKKGATPEFKAAVKAYAEARRTIDGAYRDAVKAAIDARKAAIQSDSSKTARQAAQVVFTTAVADAQAVRTQAIADLGNPPSN
jgi:hypothetical protein